jgi:hypothetical protein
VVAREIFRERENMEIRDLPFSFGEGEGLGSSQKHAFIYR